MGTSHGIEYRETEYVLNYVERMYPQLIELGIRYVRAHEDVGEHAESLIGFDTEMYQIGGDSFGTSNLVNITDSGISSPLLSVVYLEYSRDTLPGSQKDTVSAPKLADVICAGIEVLLLKFRDGLTAAVYYPRYNVILASDITHSYNNSGVELLDKILQAVLAFKKSRYDFKPPVLELPSERNIVIFGEKVYRLAGSEFKTEASFIEETAKKLKGKYTKQMGTLVSDYKKAVVTLREREREIVSRSVLLPSTPGGENIHAIAFLRYEGEKYIRARKVMHIKADKIWAIDKPTPDKLPDKFQMEMTALVDLLLLVQTADTYTMAGVQVYTYDKEYKLIGITHPHVSGTQLCTGSYTFPGSVSIREMPKVFADCKRLMQEFNPRSWYGNGVTPEFNEWLHEKHYL